ncbi:MAG: hypothetical protein GQ574_25395 [Crocinitomix sp.]|nr:hypothetical protein [Crocinitomix sp.]
MNGIELRYKLIQFITNADESKLKQLEAIFYDTGDYVVSDEHKALLDERIAEFEANPESVILWSTLKADLDAKYGV